MKLSVLEEVELAFKPGNRRAAFISIPAGALVPLATYYQTLSSDPWAMYLTAGGLLYSGLTIYSWLYSMLSFGSDTVWGRRGAAAKALGFVVLTEGTLANPPNEWVGLLVVGMLMVVNAISLHAKAVLTKASSRAAQRSARSVSAKKATEGPSELKKRVARRVDGKKTADKVTKLPRKTSKTTNSGLKKAG